MRVAIYEHTVAVDTPPGSLRTEGEAMLRAVTRDFGRVPGVEVNVVRDLASLMLGDVVLVIAPETDGILSDCLRAVEERGARSLGCSREAVALTSDKWRLAHHLQAAGVPTPTTLSDASEKRFETFPCVLKPRAGAGSQATFRVDSSEGLVAALETARGEGYAGEMIVQPFYAGQPVSVAFLIGPRQRVALRSAAQALSDDGRFRYRGGVVPLAPDLAARAERLAERAVNAIDGLRGYVGVDLVLAPGAGVVIEINPRLTTSYIGLQALAITNLAEAMLHVIDGESVQLSWRDGTIRFAADGSLA